MCTVTPHPVLDNALYAGLALRSSKRKVPEKRACSVTRDGLFMRARRVDGDDQGPGFSLSKLSLPQGIFLYPTRFSLFDAPARLGQGRAASHPAAPRF